MCGIAGIVSRNPSRVSLSQLKKMTDIISHRGPDGDGHWISANNQVGFGHRRLSIIDLTEGGHQPMHYAEGRYTITFNGEIYNYLEIKDRLKSKGYKFISQSDTEVLLALYHDQKEKCLQQLDGMFSFAIYDSQENTVFCARDRFGEKPFFYHYDSSGFFAFASEMKELWEIGIPKEVNNSMLFRYLRTTALENASDKSETFYTGIHRLENATYLLLDLEKFTYSKHAYWNIDVSNIDTSINEQAAIEKMRELFFTSIQRRLRSDVPVGSSLSGGLDSSLVVCTIDELNKNKSIVQKTFSARFPGFAKDEGAYMQMVIDRTNVKPFFTFPEQNNLLEEIDKVFYHQEEPFGSASICVQYEVMKLAKEEGVIVLLDGQGADEILAGYHTYYPCYLQEMRKLGKNYYQRELSDYVKIHGNNAINYQNPYSFKNTVKQSMPGLFNSLKTIRDKINDDSGSVYNRDFHQAYSSSLTSSESSFPTLNDMLYNHTYVKGLSELLRYADRNSMANSREVRLPFLSHELVEFLFTLPSNYKIRNGWTKYIMRRSFEDLLPKEITWRKDKIGYEPPQKKWMDDARVKEQIQHKKDLLVKNGVLNKNVLNKKPDAAAANVKGDSSWQFWMAGNLFER